MPREYSSRELQAKVAVLNPILTEIYLLVRPIETCVKLEDFICGPTFEALCRVLAEDVKAEQP